MATKIKKQQYHLDFVTEKLHGASKELITVLNNYAALGLDKYHNNSSVDFEFSIDGEIHKSILEWNSDFPKAAMKEKIDIANHGGVAIAWFVMSILMGYSYVEQTEVGDGVDYRFSKTEPSDDDLNFLDNEFHYVEVSGILEENGSNTLNNRITKKHRQIESGAMKDQNSSVIVTLFEKPKTVKEIHK